MHKLTSSELCFTSLQCFIKRCFAFASVSREKQKSVFHMTAVLHMTVSGHQLWVSFRLVCIWFQIRHAKTKLWFLHAKKKVAHPPFKLDWRRPETCKKISSTCHATFLWKLMHMQVKKNFPFGLSCSVQTAHLQGSFLPARTAAKMALASSLL